MGRGAEHLMTALCYIVVASTVTHYWPDVCLIRAVPHRVFQVVAYSCWPSASRCSSWHWSH